MLRLPSVTLLTLLALLAAACGKDTPAPPAVPIEKTTFAASTGVQLAQMTKKPSGLYVRDLVVGAGEVATPNRRVEVHYVGELADGREFDKNEAGDTPLDFVLGTGQVIVGWDEGVAGMRVGGKRQLVIPPELAYGAEGIGPIPPNAVLVFTVELVAVR